MRWTTKARIMRICAAMPGGPEFYRWGQQHFGRATPNLMPRLGNAVEISEWLRQGLGSLQGCTLFEVGTGHLPALPIFLSLLGAKRVYTADLYRRMDAPFVGRALGRLAAQRDEVRERLVRLTDDIALMDTRLELLRESAHQPMQYLSAIGVEYLAPADAAAMQLPPACIDGHFSTRVMEHIPPEVIANIFREAHRLLRPDGVAVHFVDPSDHFSHQDSSITSIQFLSYGPAEWAQLGGNQFAYCNRLRQSDLARIMSGQGFGIERKHALVEPLARQALANSFPLHSDFRGYDPDDLCAVEVRLLLRRQQNAVNPQRPAG